LEEYSARMRLGPQLWVSKIRPSRRLNNIPSFANTTSAQWSSGVVEKLLGRVTWFVWRLAKDHFCVWASSQAEKIEWTVGWDTVYTNKLMTCAFVIAAAPRDLAR
jgi:hypothetical protein